ncbi:hypothetical protein ACFSOZ_26695 [Mesorhizobium newzealandense]|uniref:Secreted protein n=1 Tax=Mesorhizobium newzealandense TaxID=1300302 RepID=A0ABW4UK70_9HYPH
MVWTLKGRSALGLGAVIAAACDFGLPSASAHDDWYEEQCCHNEHCEPIENGTVQETSKGFKVPSGELLPYADGRVRQSHDMRFHWCHAPKATAANRYHDRSPHGPDITICLYVPPKSF